MSPFLPVVYRLDPFLAVVVISVAGSLLLLMILHIHFLHSDQGIEHRYVYILLMCELAKCSGKTELGCLSTKSKLCHDIKGLNDIVVMDYCQCMKPDVCRNKSCHDISSERPHANEPSA